MIAPARRLARHHHLRNAVVVGGRTACAHAIDRERNRLLRQRRGTRRERCAELRRGAVAHHRRRNGELGQDGRRRKQKRVRASIHNAHRRDLSRVVDPQGIRDANE